jgi:acetyl esterase/lipase
VHPQAHPLPRRVRRALTITLALAATALFGANLPDAFARGGAGGRAGSASGTTLLVAQRVAPAEAPAPSPAVRVTHAYGPDPTQLLDISRPVGATNEPDTGLVRAPAVIVYFHSGGWQGGTRADVPSFAISQMARGYALVSVDYRMAPEHGYPASSEDADRAVRWVRLHAAELEVDPDRIVVAGASAGGTLAIELLASPGAHASASLPDDLRRTSPIVLAGIVAVAPVDLVALARGSSWGASIVSTYLGCVVTRCVTDPRTAAASPLAHLAPSPGPIHAVFGETDPLVVARPNAATLVDAWKAAGGLVTATIVSRHGHDTDLPAEATSEISTFLDRHT